MKTVALWILFPLLVGCTAPTNAQEAQQQLFGGFNITDETIAVSIKTVNDTEKDGAHLLKDQKLLLIGPLPSTGQYIIAPLSARNVAEPRWARRFVLTDVPNDQKVAEFTIKVYKDDHTGGTKHRMRIGPGEDGKLMIVSDDHPDAPAGSTHGGRAHLHP